MLKKFERNSWIQLLGPPLGVWILLAQTNLDLQAGERKAPPQRVISQVPAITEILYALGLEDRIVGVSGYCRFPPEAVEKPKIGGFQDASVESIVVLDPDWIALFKGQTKLEATLAPLGCRFFTPELETTRDVLKIIRELGEVFGVPDRAEKVAANMEAEMERIKQALSDLPRKKVVYVVGRQPGTLNAMYVVGENNFMDEMLEAAGGDNDLPLKTGSRYPILSKETLIRFNPEVILDGGASDEDIKNGSMSKEWNALLLLDAVKNRQVVPIGDKHLTIPGPSIPESIKKLAILIHGESAAKRLDMVGSE